MRQRSMGKKDPAEKVVRDIRRKTRRHHSAEEKICIVLEGLRGEDSIAELSRREGINSNLYYRWSTEFLEVGKKLKPDGPNHPLNQEPQSPYLSGDVQRHYPLSFPSLIFVCQAYRGDLHVRKLCEYCERHETGLRS